MSASVNESVVIKKYANRRLYNTATSSYVTLENLAEMVKAGTEFNVYDAKSNEDITRAVLTQIIVEEEGKTGQNLLPIGFLRRLIGFYGDNMQWLVPKYLEHSLQSLSKNQGQIRDYFQTTFGSMFPFGNTLEQMSKQNMAMFERTMRMFSPFGTTTSTASCCSSTDSTDSSCACASEKNETTEQTCCTTSAQTETVTTTTTTTADPEKVEEATAPTPISAGRAKKLTAVPTPETSKATAQTAGNDDVQTKIAALQRQLSELAKNKA